MPRLTSWVWKYCERSKLGIEATCNLCKEVVQTKGSTSSLIRHLQAIHGYMAEQEDDDEIPRKRNRYADELEQDDSMDIEVDESATVRLPSTSRVILEVESAGDSNDSFSNNQPFTSRQNNQLLSHNNDSEFGTFARAKPTSRSTIRYRGRVRSVAGGARPDRPCNRDRVELFSQSLTKMVVNDMLPLSFISSKGFRDFMEVMEPNYRVPCAQTIKNRLQLLYDQVSAKLALELSGATAMAWISDCWSFRSQNSYITVTTHFLDATWTPKSFTLATEELNERHTAVNLTAKLQSIMTEWKIVGKVVGVVTGNAANAKNSVRDLENLLIYDSITCAAHTLQLCIRKALKIQAISLICEKAAKVVGHFRHSNIASTALEKKQEQLGLSKLKLIQSFSTRWDSTYAMLDRLLMNRNPVMNVLSDRTVTSTAIAERLEISEREWLTMENLQKVLRPLQVATTVLCSDSLAPTSMVRPIVFKLRDIHLKESIEDDHLMESFKTSLRNELTIRFDLEHNPAYKVTARQIASFLDPRYKDLLVESPQARKDVVAFVKGYSVDEEMDETEDSSHETAMDFLFQAAQKRHTLQAQVEIYLIESQISHNSNPYEWWATREKGYPALADLARQYLCIPATSASSERVFSTAGNIVSPKRSCLLPENVNLLVFLYQNRSLS